MLFVAVRIGRFLYFANYFLCPFLQSWLLYVHSQSLSPLFLEETALRHSKSNHALWFSLTNSQTSPSPPLLMFKLSALLDHHPWVSPPAHCPHSQPSLSWSSQVDRLASSKSIYTNHSSPPPFHRLIFLLLLNISDLVNLYLTYSSFYVLTFYILPGRHLHLPWINNSHILHKHANFRLVYITMLQISHHWLI